MKTVRWGIIGCGGIANVFAKSLRVLPEGELVAVASRTPGKADAFAEKYEVEKRYTDYESMLANPDVDAVYVATTHNFHFQGVKTCLQHEKHVLCEKPFTVNAHEAEELIELAQEKKVFLMEAMWTRFLPAIVRMKEIIAEGGIGEVRAVRADFCVDGSGFDESHRMRNNQLAGGALLDLGVYPLTFADIVFDAEPEQIQSTALIGETNVDDRSYYQLSYSGGRHAQLSSSFTHCGPNDGVVMGTGGYIRVPLFWMTQALEVCRNGEEPELISFPIPDGEGFKYEIAHAMECIVAGKTESTKHPLSKTLSIMKMMDTLRAQWNMKYPGE